MDPHPAASPFRVIARRPQPVISRFWLHHMMESFRHGSNLLFYSTVVTSLPLLFHLNNYVRQGSANFPGNPSAFCLLEHGNIDFHVLLLSML
jgi:hypothetical protein